MQRYFALQMLVWSCFNLNENTCSEQIQLSLGQLGFQQ